MPTYPYRCEHGHEFDVIKSVAEIDRPEVCHEGHPAERYIARTFIDSTAGDWNRVEYSPALGQWTKGWKEARKIAKARGMEEVGTEPVENLHKAAEKRQTEIRAQRWRDADRELLYGD